MAAQKKLDAIAENGAVYVLSAGTPVYVKTADICAMTGTTNQWVGQLVSQGALHKRSTPHGTLFDVTETMRSYCDMLNVRAKANEKKESNKNELEKQEAEVSLKKAKAIVAVLEAKELQGKMHRSDDVAAMTEDLIYAVRGMLIALPGRLAVDTSNAESPAEAAELIRKEVFEVMDEIANYRYDPQKYDERVRERQSWDAVSGCDADDE